MGVEVRRKGRIPNLPFLMARYLMQIGELAVRAHLRRVTDRLAEKHSKGTTRNTLARETGQGIDRLKEFDVDATAGNEITGTLHLKGYMALHEFGGTITPKRSKYLTVPLPAALNGDGMPKQFSARARARTRVIKSKRGNLLIVMRQGRKLIPLYALKEQVRIPARLGLRKNSRRTGRLYSVTCAGLSPIYCARE